MPAHDPYGRCVRIVNRLCRLPGTMMTGGRFLDVEDRAVLSASATPTLPAVPAAPLMKRQKMQRSLRRRRGAAVLLLPLRSLDNGASVGSADEFTVEISTSGTDMHAAGRRGRRQRGQGERICTFFPLKRSSLHTSSSVFTLTMGVFFFRFPYRVAPRPRPLIGLPNPLALAACAPIDHPEPTAVGRPGRMVAAWRPAAFSISPPSPCFCWV